MSANRTVYHVFPNPRGEGWVISRENSDSFREAYRSKDEAVRAAKERARGEMPSQVKVHKTDGKMESDSTYGEDPSRLPR